MIANGFLAHANVSAAFATILIRHLLEHIENMGKKGERENIVVEKEKFCEVDITTGD